MRKLGALVLCVLFFVPVGAQPDGNQWILSAPRVSDPFPVNGMLDLPGSLDPEDFEVGNPFQTVRPSSDGSFRLPIRDTGVTFTAAVPTGYSDGSNVWLTLSAMVPEGQARRTGDDLVIDAHSTAIAHLLMHPFLLSPDPGVMLSLKEHAEALPETAALADVIESVFPTTHDPYTQSTAFLNAYTTALERIIDDLPEALSFEEEDNGRRASGSTSGTRRSALLRSESPRIELHLLDPQRQMIIDQPTEQGFSLSSDVLKDCALFSINLPQEDQPDTIVVSNQCGVGVDSYLRLWRVDLDSDQHLSGSDTFRLESARQLRGIRQRSGNFQEFETVLVRNAKTDSLEDFVPGVAPANSAMAVFDIIGPILDATGDALGLVGGADGSPNDFRLDATEPGVYVVRGFTGRYADGLRGTSGEGSHAYGTHTEEALTALVINLSNAATDVISILVDVANLPIGCITGLFTGVLSSMVEEYNQGAFETLDGALFSTLKVVILSELETTIGCVFTALAENPLRGALAVFNSVVKVVDIAGKVSAVGKVIDRLSALAGLSAFSPHLSPMETWIIVVEDPFSPLITHVGPNAADSVPFPPPTVDVGATVTLQGLRFQRFSDAQEPTVRILDELGQLFEVAPDDLTGGFGSNTTQTLTFTLPEEAAGRLAFTVSTPGGRDTVENAREILPRIDGAAPSVVSRNASEVENRTVRLSGAGFVPGRHRVKFGPASSVAPLEQSTPTALYAEVTPAVPPGRHDVLVDYRTGQTTPDSGAPQILVLGTPVLTDITEIATRQHQALIVEGRNFGTAAKEITVYFDDDSPTPRDSEDRPARAFTVGLDDDDQLAQMVIVNPFTAPSELLFPDHETRTVTVVVETPDGTSNSLTYQLGSGADPPYTRTIRMARAFDHLGGSPESILATMSNLANHEPAPEGDVINMVFCMETTCDPNNDDNFVDAEQPTCGVIYPEGLIRHPTSIGSEMQLAITPPPGIIGQIENVDPAASCDLQNCWPPGHECPGNPGPTSWENVDRDQIRQSISIPSSTQLGGTWKGPYNSIIAGTLYINNPTSPLEGGGLIIEGDGIYGAGGPPMETTISVPYVANASGTVVTIRDAYDVDVRVNIEGGDCNIGLLIEDSENVTVRSSRIVGCNDAVVIRNSTNVAVHEGTYFADYSGHGVLIEGGGGHVIGSILGTVSFNMNLSLFPGESSEYEGADRWWSPATRSGTAIRLTGGTSGNRIRPGRIVNSQIGIQIDDATDNFIHPSTIGILFAGFAVEENYVTQAGQGGGQASVGTAFVLTDGAYRNQILGNRARNDIGCPGLFPTVADGDMNIDANIAQIIVNVDRGFLLDGDVVDNLICGNFIGIPSAAHDIPLVSNETAFEIRGNGPDQPRGNVIRANHIGNNTGVAMTFDTVTEWNLIADNEFRAPTEAENDPQLPGNPAGNIMILNGSEHLEFQNNFMSGGEFGIHIENSRHLRFSRNSVFNVDNESVYAEASHILHFERENYGLSGTHGMHFDGCSAFTLEALSISGAGEDGIRIENPPQKSFGMSRIMTRTPSQTGTAPPPEPPRADIFEPIAFPPDDRHPVVGVMRIIGAGEHGIHILNGPRDIFLAGIDLSNSGNHALMIDNPGRSIVVQENRIVYNGPPTAPDPADGIRIANASFGDPRHGVQVGGVELGNVLFANTGYGLRVIDSDHVTVEGNFVGFDPLVGIVPPEFEYDGGPPFESLYSNLQGGILVEGSDEVDIGGEALGSANLVSGNEEHGIELRPSSNGHNGRIEIRRNFIGVDPTGTEAARNRGNGIRVHTGDDEGPTSLDLIIAENLIAGNRQGGVRIQGKGGHQGLSLVANLIGSTDDPGWIVARDEPPQEPLGVPSDGSGVVVHVTPDVTLDRNIIADHAQHGIHLVDAKGTDISGNAIRGNVLDGISVDVFSSTILIQGNLVEGHGRHGIGVRSLSRRTTMLQNIIRDNFGSPIIVLGGANEGIGIPVIRDIEPTAGGQTIVRGDTPRGSTEAFVVELYEDPENQLSKYVATTTGIFGGFRFLVADDKIGSGNLLVTATDAAGNTSEAFGLVFIPGRPQEEDPPLDEDSPEEIEEAFAALGLTRWIVAERDGSLHALNLTTGETVLIEPTDEETVMHPDVLEGATLAQTAIVYAAMGVDGTRLFELFGITGPASEISPTGSGEFDDFMPSLSPDGERVLFASDREGPYNIHVADSGDGANHSVLVSSSDSDLWPAWHPSGNRFAFVSNRSGNFEIWVADDDGGNLTQVTDGTLHHWRPRWIDSETLVSQVSETAPDPFDLNEAAQELALVQESDGNTVLLTTSGADDFSPAVARGPQDDLFLAVPSRTSAEGSTPAGTIRLYVTTPTGETMWRLSPAGDDEEWLHPACCLPAGSSFP